MKNDFMNPDNPDLHIGVRIYLKTIFLGPYLAFAILGTLFWILSYMLFYFYKDYLITHFKKEEDRGYYYKYLDSMSKTKPIIIFTFIVLSFWIVLFVLLREWSHYTFSIGFGILLIILSVYNVKYYLIDKHSFDLVDEYVYLFKKLFWSKTTSQYKKKKD